MTEIFMSMKMDIDPVEREIYVRCPECNRKVFDNGVDNSLQCIGCQITFEAEKQQ